MFKNTGTRLGYGFGILAILMAITIAGNSAATSTHQTAQGSAASKISGSAAKPTAYFPLGYVNGGRDGDGNVMTYEHG